MKVELLKRIDDKESLKSALKHFDNIPETEYNVERKKALNIEINNYLLSQA